MDNKIHKTVFIFSKAIRYVLCVMCYAILLAPALVSAADYSLDKYDPLRNIKNYTDPAAGGPYALIAQVLNYVMGFLGAVVFGVFIFGGVTILFSRGDSKKVKTGRDTLAYATIGLAIIFFSYAILNLVFNLLSDIKK